MRYVAQVLKGRHVLLALVSQDLRNRYRKSALGLAWALLTPLGLVGIVGFVFSILLGQSMDSFLPFLFSGLLSWIFVVGCAEGGAGAFLAAEGYIKQTGVPIEIFPVRVVMVAFINLLFSTAAYFLICPLFFALPVTARTLALVPALGILFFFGVGVATVSGIVNTYYRDYAPFQSLVLQGLFYGTPIMYRPDMISQRGYSWIYLINPFYYLVDIFRQPLLGDAATTWVPAFSIAAACFGAALFLIGRIGRHIAFRL